MPANSSAPNPSLGIAIKIVAVVFVAIIAALVKSIPDDLPNTQLVFFRCFLALPFVIGFAYHQAGGELSETRKMLTPNQIWLHIRRASFGLISMFLIFASVRLAPLPIANALKELSPILITLLAALFLGETIRFIRTFGLILGVVGVAIITYDALTGQTALTYGPQAAWGALAALLAALTIALAQIQIRSMVGKEHPTAIVTWFFIFGMMVSLPFAPFTWQMPSAQGWLWLFGIGFCGGMGQLAITMAYRFADASTVAPFEYFSIPFTLLIGGIFFDEWPHYLSLIGMGFILAGGLIIIYREQQLARQARRERKAAKAH